MTSRAEGRSRGVSDRHSAIKSATSSGHSSGTLQHGCREGLLWRPVTRCAGLLAEISHCC